MKQELYWRKEKFVVRGTPKQFTVEYGRYKFTSTQLKVLKLKYQGCTDKQIAIMRDRKPNTIRNELRNLRNSTEGLSTPGQHLTTIEAIVVARCLQLFFPITEIGLNRIFKKNSKESQEPCGKVSVAAMDT